MSVGKTTRHLSTRWFHLPYLPPPPQADYVRMRDHARWRYLLSADGFTASCRLGKLLGTNSVVVKVGHEEGRGDCC